MSSSTSESGGPQLPFMGLQPAQLKSNSLRMASFVAPTASLPAKVDLRSQFPPVYDQGQLGSCTANATCGAVQFLLPSFMGSRLFLYYQERALYNNTSVDSGGYLHDCVSILETTGIAPESDWPYVTSQFAATPPAVAYADAPSHKVLQAMNIPVDPQQLKGCLASGYPWIFGIAIYTSFFSAACCYGVTVNGAFVKPTGIVSVPGPADTIYGYHAICAVGYDDVNQWWIIRNSWGTGIGDNGYFYFPYSYLTSQFMACDIWTIRVITSGLPTNCTVGLWSDPVCSVSACGTTGTATMTRSVIAPATNGGTCPVLTQTTVCQNDPCKPPATNCIVGNWSAPSSCSVTACGSTGTQTMTRTATQPTNGGDACPSLTQTQTCQTAACPPPVNTNCVVGPWSAYSDCDTKVCGARGVQTSSRIVLNPASGNGAVCPALLQTQYCRVPVCLPRACSVGPWSDWTVCSSKVCGIPGTQTASRQVTEAAATGGAACPALTYSSSCNPPCGHDAQTVLVTVGAAAILVPLIVLVVLIL